MLSFCTPVDPNDDGLTEDPTPFGEGVVVSRSTLGFRVLVLVDSVVSDVELGVEAELSGIGLVLLGTVLTLVVILKGLFVDCHDHPIFGGFEVVVGVG